MRELRIRLGTGRSANAADHFWRDADGAPGSERPWGGGLPEAERTVVIVPAERATVVALAPPPLSERKLAQALPWLVEAQLIEPVEHYELLRIGGPAGDGLLCIVALERDWLAEVRRQLSAVRQGDVEWVLAGSYWRLPAGSWGLRVDGDRALLSMGGTEVIAAASATLADTLRALVSGGGDSAGRRPREIRCLGLDLEAREAIAGALSGTSVALVEAPDRDLPDAFDADLPQAPVLFAQRRSALRQAFTDLLAWPRWRAAAGVLAVLAAVEVLAPLIRWGQLRLEENRLRDSATAVFREVAGERAVVVDPWLQMRRLDQGSQHAQGRAVADDLLPMLDAVTRLLPDGIGPASEVRYSERTLEMVFGGEAARAVSASLPALTDALRAKGWKCQGETDAASRLTLRVERA